MEDIIKDLVLENTSLRKDNDRLRDEHFEAEKLIDKLDDKISTLREENRELKNNKEIDPKLLLAISVLYKYQKECNMVITYTGEHGQYCSGKIIGNQSVVRFNNIHILQYHDLLSNINLPELEKLIYLYNIVNELFVKLINRLKVKCNTQEGTQSGGRSNGMKYQMLLWNDIVNKKYLRGNYIYRGVIRGNSPHGGNYDYWNDNLLQKAINDFHNELKNINLLRVIFQ